MIFRTTHKLPDTSATLSNPFHKMTVGGLTDIVVDFPENTQGAAEFIFVSGNCSVYAS